MKEIYGVIYIIKNNMNNKMYIGQTTKDFDKRYNYNLYNSTHNEHLKHSIEKYGIENFTIIKEFDIAYSKEELDALEDMYIKIYNTIDSEYGYNKKFGGANGLPSEETKHKISEAGKGRFVSEETRYKLSKAGKGRKFTEEHKQRLSESRKGKYCGEKSSLYGKSFTEDHKQHLSDSLKGKGIGSNNPRARKIAQYDKQGNLIKVWDCVKDASIFLGCEQSTLCKCAKGKIKTSHGFIWKYIE